MVTFLRRTKSISGAGRRSVVLVAVAAGILVIALPGCGRSDVGEGAVSKPAYGLEVLGFEQPAELPGDLGFPAPVPGDAYAAIEVRISKQSKPDTGETDHLSQTDLRVRTSEGRALSFVIVPGDLFLDPDEWTPGGSRTGTLYLEVPAAVLVADVVLVSDEAADQVVPIER